ncbi:60S ribosomal protein L5 [Capsicum chinense]|nr:60S ribosomal protein L5 [Capsicum chinense]
MRYPGQRPYSSNLGMKALMEDKPEKYQSLFSVYLKSGLEQHNIEEMYNLKKQTYEERKDKLIKRLNALNATGGNDDDDDKDGRNLSFARLVE